jgi:hypothetical protein
MKRCLLIFAFVFTVANAANAQKLLWQYMVPIPAGTYTSTWQGGNGFADSGTGRSAWVVYRNGTNGQLILTQVVWLDSNRKLIKETDFAGSMYAQIIRLTPSALYLWVTWGVQNVGQIMRISPGKTPNSTINISDGEQPASFSQGPTDPSGFFTTAVGGNGFLIYRYSN